MLLMSMTTGIQYYLVPSAYAVGAQHVYLLIACPLACSLGSVCIC